MRHMFFAAALGWLAPALLHGQSIEMVEVVDSVNRFAAVDFRINLDSPTDGATGTHVIADSADALFRLTVPLDPNDQRPVMTVPNRDGGIATPEEQFRCFVSKPADDQFLRRFGDNRAPTFAGPLVDGSYTPGHLQFFGLYLPVEQGRSGWVARAAVDIPDGIDPDDIYVSSGLQRSGDYVLAAGIVRWSTAATEPNTVDVPWVLAAVPEPATFGFMAVAVAGVAGFRHSQRRTAR